MSSFGVDEAVLLQAEDLAEAPRFGEATSLGGALAFTLKTFWRDVRGAHCSATNLHVLDMEGGGVVKQMTRLEKGGVSNPAFVPHVLGANEAVMYLQAGQVRSLPLEGGESVLVTSFPLDVESFKVFKGPHETVMLACVMSVYPDKTPEETADIDAAKSQNVHSTGMVFDTLMVRHWDTWKCYEKRNHVFVTPLTVSVSGHLVSEATNSMVVDLMLGYASDCPPKPFGGAEEYEASPAGDMMVLTCRRVTETKQQPSDMAWSTEVSVFTIPIPDFKSEHKHTAPPDSNSSESSSADVLQLDKLTLISDSENCATHSSPVVSPDGKFVAFLAMSRATYESDRFEIVLFNLENRKLTYPSRNIDLSFGTIMFDPSTESGNQSLICTAQYRGSNRIYQLSVIKDGSFQSLAVMPGDESRSSPLIVKNRTGPMSLYFFESSLISPNILKKVKLDGTLFKFVNPSHMHTECITGEVPFSVTSAGSIRSLRDVYCPCPGFINGDLTMPHATQYYFPAEDSHGTKNGSDLVHMIYLPPVQLQCKVDEENASPSSFPLVLIIHGGPQGAILNSWHYRWNLSYYSSKGYGVIAVNFHGSTGFGQDYVDSIRNDWGGQPFRDCLSGVHDILANKTYLDRNRVGALGASYGGYMINWINGHSDFFKCLVNHDGIFNLRTLYYSTEELWFPEWEFGVPWCQQNNSSDVSQYDKWNPENSVQNWKTPTLVIQGGKDYRVVETEGLSTFTALQRQGIPSQFLFFPDENHWCLKTANSLHWHATVISWLDKWLKN